MSHLTNRPPVARLIDRFEGKTNLIFRPSRQFYESTGINRIRFAQLAKGNKNPDSVEIKALVGFFKQFFPVTSEDLLS